MSQAIPPVGPRAETMSPPFSVFRWDLAASIRRLLPWWLVTPEKICKMPRKVSDTVLCWLELRWVWPLMSWLRSGCVSGPLVGIAFRSWTWRPGHLISGCTQTRIRSTRSCAPAWRQRSPVRWQILRSASRLPTDHCGQMRRAIRRKRQPLENGARASDQDALHVGPPGGIKLLPEQHQTCSPPVQVHTHTVQPHSKRPRGPED